MKQLILVYFLFITATLSAQQVQYSMLPQYFMISGLRTDLDVRLGENTWVVLAPHLFAHEENNTYDKHIDYGDPNYENSKYDKMLGYGGNIGLKHYLPFKTSRGWQFLFKYGLSYMQYEMDYKGVGWHTIDHEGLEALEYGLYEQQTHIQQYGGIMYMGLFIPVDERFFIELFLGSKLKYSRFTFTGEDERRFNDDIFSPGYTGILPYMGVRYGMRF